jgi:hypothetical protein
VKAQTFFLRNVACYRVGLAPRFQKEKLRFQQKKRETVVFGPMILGTRVLKNAENLRFKIGAGSQLF